MKINAITLNKNKTLVNNRPCRNSSIPFYMCSEYPKDTISFGLNKHMNNLSKIDSFIENKELRQEIKEKLSDSKNKNYESLQDDFISYYQLMLDSFKEINTKQKKDMMALAVCETLRLISPSSDPQREIGLINSILDAYNAIVHNQTNIYEVYDVCEKNGSVNTETANKIFFWQYTLGQKMHPYSSKLILERYCTDKNGNISNERIANIAGLFNYTHCDFASESDEFVKLVLENPNDYTSEIDNDKYSFLILNISRLYSCAYNELLDNYGIALSDIVPSLKKVENKYDREIITKFCNEIKLFSLETISSLIKNNTDKNNNFDIEAAQKSFDFILQYAREYRYTLNETKTFRVLGANPYGPKKEVSLNEIIGDEKARYDNSVYRMHRILVPDEINEKYLN